MELTVDLEGLILDVPVAVTGDFQTPDRIQGTLSITLLGAPVETRIISIGATTYQQDSETSEWEIIADPA